MIVLGFLGVSEVRVLCERKQLSRHAHTGDLTTVEKELEPSRTYMHHSKPTFLFQIQEGSKPVNLEIDVSFITVLSNK